MEILFEEPSNKFCLYTHLREERGKVYLFKYLFIFFFRNNFLKLHQPPEINFFYIIFLNIVFYIIIAWKKILNKKKNIFCMIFLKYLVEVDMICSSFMVSPIASIPPYTSLPKSPGFGFFLAYVNPCLKYE